MPVAANHGTDMIMKMNVIRPPYLAWHTPQRQYHSRPGLFHASTENSMLPLKMLASVAR
jgi:hypothetical protein